LNLQQLLYLQKQSAKALELRRNARNNLLPFCAYTIPDYTVYPFHHKLAGPLEAVERGEINRLIITIPPGHTKTTTAATGFPAWALGRNPQKKILGVSNTSDLAGDIGQRVRDTIASEEYQTLFPGIRLRQDTKAKRRWHTNARGQYNGAGVNTAILGKRCNLAVIDDPVPGVEEAESVLWNQKFHRWWTGNLLSRLDPGAAIVVIMQRLTEDDPVGWLLENQKVKENPNKWKVINLPILMNEKSEADDNGEFTLWPEQYTLDIVKDIQNTRDTRTWSAQYQQQPEKSGGTIFKRDWFRFWSHVDGGPHATRRLPDFPDDLAQSWDMAFKDTATSSFVCGQAWLKKGANVFLIGQTRDKLDFTQSVDAVRDMTTKYPQIIGKLIEDKANGPAVIASLKNEINGIIPISPVGSKTSRAYAIQPMVKAGNVFLPLPTMPGYEWVEDYIKEMVRFTGAGNQRNDQVDCTTQVINHWNPRKTTILDVIQNLR
jgi:predicted phage terminase large subunit-like protein